MATRAKVTSVEALESFRASLIVYLSKARPTVEEVSSDVVRLRTWLESDQRMFWEKEMRRRMKKLEEAQQALFSAELSGLTESMTVERMAVTKAKRAVDEAELKVRAVKKWDREFGTQIEPLVKQLERLDTILVNEMPEAIFYLSQAIKTLHEYAGIQSPGISIASEKELPLPTKNEGGEDKGEGALTEASSSPQPSLPLHEGEGEENLPQKTS
jgi:hypothetical protein